MAFAVRSSIPLRVEAVMLARPLAVRAALGLLVRPCGEFSYARTGATTRMGKVDSPLRSGKPATGAASRRGVPVFTSQTCAGDWEVPAPVPLGLRHVVLPRAADPLLQRRVHGPHHAAGDADHERTGRDHHPLRYDGPRSHHTPRPDPRVVQQDAPHPDQAFVLDRAAVQHGAVPDAHAGADRRGKPLVHVNDRAVLHVAGLTDPDRRHIAAQHGPIPDARARAERHVPQHDGARGDEGAPMDVDYSLVGFTGYCTQASTGSPFLSAGFHRRVFARSSAWSLKVSTLDRTNTRTSCVSPLRDTWNSRMAGRGKTGASPGTGTSAGCSGMGRVSKQTLS